MISIIIPIYNTEKYLRRCIDSVLNSTCQDFEIILVNDGSGDSCSQICRQYSQGDCRIRYIDQIHKGVSEARNRGIQESRGEWLVFIDSDDMIAPDFLEMVERKEYQNQELLLFDLAVMTRRFKKEENIISGEQNSTVFYYEKKDRDFLIESLLNVGQLIKCGSTNLLSSGAKAYKKEVINRYSISFPTDITIGEDRLFNIEYLLKMQSCAYVTEKVYFVEIRSDSAMRGFQPNYLQNDLRYQKRLIAILDKNDILSTVKHAYYNSVLSNMADILVRGVFHPRSTRSYSENRRLCHEMQENEIYKKALKYNGHMGVVPRKLLLFFYRLKCYGIVNIICKLSYMVLEKMERL